MLGTLNPHPPALTSVGQRPLRVGDYKPAESQRRRKWTCPRWSLHHPRSPLAPLGSAPPGLPSRTEKGPAARPRPNSNTESGRVALTRERRGRSPSPSPSRAAFRIASLRTREGSLRRRTETCAPRRSPAGAWAEHTRPGGGGHAPGRMGVLSGLSRSGTGPLDAAGELGMSSASS